MDDRGPIRRQRVIYVKKSLSARAKRRLKWLGISLLIFIVLCTLLVFVGFPIVFMKSLALQQILMFTNINLHTDQAYFNKYEVQPGLRNLYVTVKDKSGTLISLGVWHLLPLIFEQIVMTQENFNFDDALRYSNISILLYFHGKGQDRSGPFSKYNVFRYFFHVITFDYRSFGDSSEGELLEDAVVDDCIQVFEWLASKTTAPIFIWGHSLGTALAARTAALLTQNDDIAQPVGLILEAPFTNMRDELYVYPFSKIFSWLPWFEATVIQPLKNNGFIFDTSKHVMSIKYPIMILNAEDDNVVPYSLGEKLYKIATSRSPNSTTLYYKFPYEFGYGHDLIYLDALLVYYINYFHFICLNREQRNETDQY